MYNISKSIVPGFLHASRHTLGRILSVREEKDRIALTRASQRVCKANSCGGKVRTLVRGDALYIYLNARLLVQRMVEQRDQRLLQHCRFNLRSQEDGVSEERLEDLRRRVLEPQSVAHGLLSDAAVYVIGNVL